MVFHKRLQKEIAAKNEIALTVMSVPGLILVNIVAQLLVWWMAAQEDIFPGTDVFFSIISTCSEIIAGLYGITLAGYTFFLSRIDSLMASDTTLTYVVASIKNRFKYLIWYITLNVLITLFISITLMYAPAPDGEQTSYFYRLFCNEFILFLAFSIILILCYSILVVDPNCLEREAAKLKKKISRRGSAGSVAEFISLYDRIETACNGLLPASVLNQVHENKGKRFEYTIELLREQKVLALPLIVDLNRIHRYYSCMINCSPLSVSEEMCVLARRMAGFLENEGAKRTLSK